MRDDLKEFFSDIILLVPCNMGADDFSKEVQAVGVVHAQVHVLGAVAPQDGGDAFQPALGHAALQEET